MTEESKTVTPLDAKDRPSIILPASVQNAGILKDIQSQKETVHEKADENYYGSILGATLGKAVFAVVAGRNRERAKAFENPDIRKFFKEFFKFVEQRAHEMGYFSTDVRVSKLSGITKDGYLVIKIEPVPGARRIL